MAERQSPKPEIAAHKRTLKLAPAIGDWTTYKPAKVLAKKVTSGLYGFDRLSREELDLFMMLHYQLVEAMLKRLKTDLQLAVELFSVSVEQTNYLNFLRGLNTPVVQAKLNFPNRHEGAALVIDLSLANSIINHSLGSHDLEALNRGLSDAENAVLSTALTEYLSGYSATFHNVVGQPAIALTGSPDAVADPAVNPSATFVCFSAEAALADNAPGKIQFGYLAPVIKELLQLVREKKSQQPLNFKKLPATLLGTLHCPAEVRLGTTALTTNDIERLEPGDVVTLDNSINAAVPMTIGGRLKLFCQPGIRDNKAAVRVAVIREEAVKVAPPAVETIEQPEPTPPPAPAKPILPVKPLPTPPKPVPLPEPIEEELEEEEEGEEGEEDFLGEEDFAEGEDDFSLDDDDFKL